MLHGLIENISAWGLQLISAFGYVGLFVTMMLESMAIPIPSEVIVPFGGFLAASRRFSFWPVVLVTSVANLIGAVILYGIGYFAGSAFLRRYGKYILVQADDVERLERWLHRFGRRVAFIARLIPGTRTFSSVVFGAGEMKLGTFALYTFLGSFAWNLPWTYLGYKAGKNWNQYQPYVRRFDYLIIIVIVLLVAGYIWRHLRRNSKFKIQKSKCKMTMQNPKF